MARRSSTTRWGGNGRRLAISLAGIVGVTLGLAACGSGSNSQPGPTATDLSAFYNQDISWKSCRGELMCARITVPLNYANPQGETISVDVLKVPAGDPNRRQGSLVINPGGPGASGMEFAQYASGTLSQQVMAQFDVIGFDPRGVAASTPIECLDGPQLDALLANLGSPVNAEQLATVEQVAASVGQGCSQKSPALTPAIGTIDAARDMDVLRALLGEPKLNYLGLSYGTMLGLLYIEQFPAQVGRFVLDGVVNPAMSLAEMAHGQADGFQLALSRFIADCPTHKDCPLPTGESVALAKLNGWLNQVAVQPIRGEVGRPLTRPLAVNSIIASLYAEGSGWPQLREILAAGFAGNGRPMIEVVDSFTGRKPNGTYRDNAIEALYGVTCLDRADRVGAQATQVLADQWSQKAPTFGPELAWSNLPCATWPAPATFQPHPITTPTELPVLLIGTTYDPATPIQWAQEVASALPNNRLLTYVDDGHTATGDNECVDAVIDAQLLLGQAPQEPKVCTP